MYRFKTRTTVDHGALPFTAVPTLLFTAEISISTEPVKWTEVVSAYSSVGSAVIAAIAAVFAYRAYRKQAGQLELAQKHDRSWQAAKVAAWLDAERTREANGVNEDGLRWLVFALHNASDLPVHHVKLQDPKGDIYEYGTLIPQENPQYVHVQASEFAVLLWQAISITHRHSGSFSDVLNFGRGSPLNDGFWCEFKDSQGRFWRRSTGGELSEHKYDWRNDVFGPSKDSSWWRYQCNKYLFRRSVRKTARRLLKYEKELSAKYPD